MYDNIGELRQAYVRTFVLILQESREVSFADIIFLKSGSTYRYAHLLGNIFVVLIEECHHRFDLFFLAEILRLDTFQGNGICHFQLFEDSLQSALDVIQLEISRKNLCSPSLQSFFFTIPLRLLNGNTC